MLTVDVDGLTQIIVEREATEEEMKQRETDMKADKADMAKEAKEAKETAAKRASAMAKLTALGIDVAELAALFDSKTDATL